LRGDEEEPLHFCIFTSWTRVQHSIWTNTPCRMWWKCYSTGNFISDIFIFIIFYFRYIHFYYFEMLLFEFFFPKILRNNSKVNQKKWNKKPKFLLGMNIKITQFRNILDTALGSW